MEKLLSELTNERQNREGAGEKIVLPGDEKNQRLPLISLTQARLLRALLRQASYWPCSGRPHIGFAQAGLSLAL